MENKSKLRLIFKECPKCKKLFFGLQAHMHMHIKNGTMTQKEFDKMFKEKKC